MADGGTGSGPRDAAVMESILKEMGVEEYEPNVVHQMLEFSYRYITNVLEDARVYSEHAQKKELDVSDVKLAVQTRMDHSFTTPPPRDFLIEVAREKNSTPLPLIPEKFGPRLPPERYCLTANNYRIKERHKPSSLSKPQVTLSATFRLPLKQTTTTATSSLRSQLTSPLLQSTGLVAPTGTSKIVMLTGSGPKQQTSTAGLLAQLQQHSSSSAKQNMPTLGSLGSGQGRGNNSSSNNNIQTTSNRNGISLSMPTLNPPK